jgi:DNA-binding NarL/FixJ family response regulator
MQVVGEAADGEEAIELARSLVPDILIVDISMPKVNGLAVTSQLSREMPNLKIVGLSMHEREDMARAMRAAGAEAYLTKGGASESLLGVLRQLSPGV